MILFCFMLKHKIKYNVAFELKVCYIQYKLKEASVSMLIKI